jgi:hypothetical protein
VRITDVFACSVVAEGPQGDALSQRGVLAADHLDVAHFSGPTHAAQALITILDLSARRLVLAGVGGAPVDVLAAVFTCVTIGTMTSVVRRVVLTSGAVQTWRAVAQIDAILTVGTGVARPADASVRVDAVDAGPVVHATAFGAVVVVGLTVDPREAQRTSASVRIDVLVTSGAILTRIGQALVDVDVALFPFESVDAEASVVADVVQTSATILTGICNTYPIRHQSTVINRD